VHAIDAESGALGSGRQFAGGKGGNWVEIVALD